MIMKPNRDMGSREPMMIDASGKKPKKKMMAMGGYADGGEAEMEDGMDDMDQEKLMDHCAVEAMHAIKNGDVKSFRDAIGCLIMDMVGKCNGGQI